MPINATPSGKRRFEWGRRSAQDTRKTEEVPATTVTRPPETKPASGERRRFEWPTRQNFWKDTDKLAAEVKEARDKPAEPAPEKEQPPPPKKAGLLQWYELASDYGRFYDVPPEITLSLIGAESGGDHLRVGDDGHSVGLFQLHDEGVGYGYSEEERQEPLLQFQLMMPRISEYYKIGKQNGLKDRRLAEFVGGMSERSAAEYHYRYGDYYEALVEPVSALRNVEPPEQQPPTPLALPATDKRLVLPDEDRDETVYLPDGNKLQLNRSRGKGEKFVWDWLAGPSLANKQYVGAVRGESKLGKEQVDYWGAWGSGIGNTLSTFISGLTGGFRFNPVQVFSFIPGAIRGAGRGIASQQSTLNIITSAWQGGVQNVKDKQERTGELARAAVAGFGRIGKESREVKAELQRLSATGELTRVRAETFLETGAIDTWQGKTSEEWEDAREFAYTWVTQPEKEKEFLAALEFAENEAGRALTRVETDDLKKLYEDPMIEFWGEVILDPLNIIPPAVFKAVFWPVKWTLGTTAKVAARAPLIKGLIAEIPRSAARTHTRNFIDVLNRMARTAGKTVKAGADEIPSEVISPELWQKYANGDPSIITNMSPRDITRITRLSEEGGHFGLAFKTGERSLGTLIGDAYKKAAGDFVDWDSLSVTQKNKEVTDKLRQSMQNLYQQQNQVPIDRQIIDKAGNLIDAPTEHVKGSGFGKLWRNARAIWIEANLSARPGFTVRNMLDTRLRFMLAGGNTFQSLQTIVSNKRNYFPPQIMEGFVRALREKQHVGPITQRVIEEGKIGVTDFVRAFFGFSPVSVLDPDAASSLGMVKLPFITREFPVLKDIPIIRNVNLQNVAEGLGDFNDAFEMAHRMRLYHDSYWKVFNQLDGKYGQELIRQAIKDPAMRKDALRMWNTASNSPEDLDGILKSARAGNLRWEELIPEDVLTILRKAGFSEGMINDFTQTFLRNLEEASREAAARGATLGPDDIANVRRRAEEELLENHKAWLEGGSGLKDPTGVVDEAKVRGAREGRNIETRRVPEIELAYPEQARYVNAGKRNLREVWEVVDNLRADPAKKDAYLAITEYIESIRQVRDRIARHALNAVNFSKVNPKNLKINLRKFHTASSISYLKQTENLLSLVREGRYPPYNLSAKEFIDAMPGFVVEVVDDVPSVTAFGTKLDEHLSSSFFKRLTKYNDFDSPIVNPGAAARREAVEAGDSASMRATEDVIRVPTERVEMPVGGPDDFNSRVQELIDGGSTREAAKVQAVAEGRGVPRARPVADMSEAELQTELVEIGQKMGTTDLRTTAGRAVEARQTEVAEELVRRGKGEWRNQAAAGPVSIVDFDQKSVLNTLPVSRDKLRAELVQMSGDMAFDEKEVDTLLELIDLNGATAVRRGEADTLDDYYRSRYLSTITGSYGDVASDGSFLAQVGETHEWYYSRLARAFNDTQLVSAVPGKWLKELRRKPRAGVDRISQAEVKWTGLPDFLDEQSKLKADVDGWVVYNRHGVIDPLKFVDEQYGGITVETTGLVWTDADAAAARALEIGGGHHSIKKGKLLYREGKVPRAAVEKHLIDNRLIIEDVTPTRLFDEMDWRTHGQDVGTFDDYKMDVHVSPMTKLRREITWNKTAGEVGHPFVETAGWRNAADAHVTKVEIFDEAGNTIYSQATSRAGDGPLSEALAPSIRAKTLQDAESAAMEWAKKEGISGGPLYRYNDWILGSQGIPTGVVGDMGENYREYLITLPVNRHTEKAYISQHFQSAGEMREVPNIVMHMRATDRVVDGKRVLFLEELQSDWIQTANKTGVFNATRVAELEEKLLQIKGAQQRALKDHPHFGGALELDADLKVLTLVSPNSLAEVGITEYVHRVRRALDKSNFSRGLRDIIGTPEVGPGGEALLRRKLPGGLTPELMTQGKLRPDARERLRRVIEEGRWDERLKEELAFFMTVATEVPGGHHFGGRYGWRLDTETGDLIRLLETTTLGGLPVAPEDLGKVISDEIYRLYRKLARERTNEIRRNIGPPGFGRPTTAATLSGTPTPYSLQITETEGFLNAAKRGVPPPPFSDDWKDVGMKRMVRYAAEGNYDAIAWTTGKQQSVRYGKYIAPDEVGHITWNPETKEFKVLSPQTEQAYGDDITSTIVPENYPKDEVFEIQEQDLYRWIDPDNAKALMDSPVQEQGAVHAGAKILRGRSPRDAYDFARPITEAHDIEIMSGGFVQAYDEEMVSFMKRFGKQWDEGMETRHLKTGWSLGEVEDFLEPIHYMSINDEMRKGLKDPTELMQGAKGMVKFEGERAFVRLFESADFSTLVHEFAGHPFLRNILRENSADYRVVKGWINKEAKRLNKLKAAGELSDEQLASFFIDARGNQMDEIKMVVGGDLTFSAEEIFARGFERYLLDGTLPAPGLKSLFDRIRDYLLKIYRVVTGSPLDLELSDDIRVVFDRLLEDPEGYAIQAKRILSGEPIVAYHGGMEPLETIGLKGEGGFFGFHAGTEEAARARLAKPSVADDEVFINKVKITPKQPYLPEGRILDERLADDRMFLFEVGRFDEKGAQEGYLRADELLEQGYDVIPYINTMEAEGVVSYMVIDPSAVKVVGKPLKGTVGKGHPYRFMPDVNDRGIKVINAYRDELGQGPLLFPKTKSGFFSLKNYPDSPAAKAAGYESQEALQTAAAKILDDAPLNDTSEIVKVAYEHLTQQIGRQYRKLDVQVQAFLGEDEPYRFAQHLRDDVMGNDRLLFRPTERSFGASELSRRRSHPLLAKTTHEVPAVIRDETGKIVPMLDDAGAPVMYQMSEGDLLRATHDYISHFALRSEFDVVGDVAGWQAHIRTIDDPLARWALTNETLVRSSHANSGLATMESAWMPSRLATDVPEQKVFLPPLKMVLTGDSAVDAPIRELMERLPGYVDEPSYRGIPMVVRKPRPVAGTTDGPFRWQEANIETIIPGVVPFGEGQIIHDMAMHGGDVFRGLAGNGKPGTLPRGYVLKKAKKIADYTDPDNKGTIIATIVSQKGARKPLFLTRPFNDEYALARQAVNSRGKKVADIMDHVAGLWAQVPIETPLQAMARDMNIALLRGNRVETRRIALSIMDEVGDEAVPSTVRSLSSGITEQFGTPIRVSRPVGDGFERSLRTMEELRKGSGIRLREVGQADLRRTGWDRLKNGEGPFRYHAALLDSINVDHGTRYTLDDIIPYDEIQDTISRRGFDPNGGEVLTQNFHEAIDGHPPGSMASQFLMQAQDDTGVFSNALRKWENDLLGKTGPVTMEDWGGVTQWAERAKMLKAYLNDIAMFGTERGEIPAELVKLFGENSSIVRELRELELRGAVGHTNDAMIDYSRDMVIDEAMKTVIPFWKFPSRSIPWWVQTLGTNPRILSNYNKIQELSERMQLQAGATRNAGGPLPRLRGHFQLGDTDWWYDPFNSLSFTDVVPQRGPSFDTTDTIDPDAPLVNRLVNYLYAHGGKVGLYLAPWVDIPIRKMTNIIDENQYPERSLFGQLDLIPPWTQRYLIQKTEATINWNESDYLTPQVPWKGYLVARELLSITAVTIADTTDPSEKLRLARLAETALQSQEGELYEQARDNIERSEYTARLFGYLSGAYAKKFGVGERELFRVRDEANRLARKIASDANYEEIYKTWRYETGEGVLRGLYGSISWVRDENDEPVYRDRWWEEVSSGITTSQQKTAYLAERNRLWANLQAGIFELAIGDSQGAAELATEYYDADDELKEKYPEARFKWSPYFKSDATIKEYIIGVFMGYLRDLKPRYDKTEETFPEYEERLENWYEVVIPASAAPALAHVVEELTEEEEGVVIDGVETTKVTGVDLQTAIGDGSVLLAMANREAYDTWDLTTDGVYDALNRVWRDNFYNRYWDLVAERSGYERDVAEQIFADEFPERPGEDEIVEWVFNLYGQQFEEKDLRDAINGRDIYSVEEKMTRNDTPEETMAREIWNVIAWVGPNKKALRDAMGDEVEWLDFWYKTDGDPTAFGDNEEFHAFYDMIMDAKMMMGVEEPTMDQTRDFMTAEGLNDEFRGYAQAILGDDIFDLQSFYFGLTADEKRAFRES